MTFLSLMQATASILENDKPIDKFLTNIVSWTGIIFFGIILFYTFKDYNRLFSIENIKSTALTPILTLLYLPLPYLFALYMTYETLFLSIKFSTKDIQKRNYL